MQIVAETLTVYTFIQFFDALLVRDWETQLKLFKSDAQRRLCVALPVCLLRDSSRVWDAEDRCPVEPGRLLLRRSSSGSGSDV